MNTTSRILRLLGITAVLAATPLAAVYYQVAMFDPDMWWRLRVGEFITGTHRFPETLIFSRFSTNPWETHSWIFDVMMSLVYRWFSLPGLPVALYLFQIILAALLVACLSKLARSTWFTLLLAAACFSACFHTLAPRAVLFTILFFILELALIFNDLQERRIRAMYWMPVIFLLWANCHIQFVNGFVVLGLLCGCEFIQQFISAKVTNAAPDLPCSKLLLISFACVAATLLNPYTWHMYVVIWGYLTKAGQWDQIVELLAPDFRRPAHFVEVAITLAAAWSLGANRSRSLFRIALLATSAIVSFHAVREAWMISIVSAFLLAEAWQGAAERTEIFSWKELTIASSLALIVALAAQIQIAFTQQQLIAQIDRMFPVRAASFVADNRPPGPIYNSMNWGGYLIYNLREYPVSIDGRNEGYGGDIGGALNVTQGGAGWKNDPTFASSNLVLIEKNLPLARLLAEDPDFKMIYQDHLAMVFVRTRR